LDDVELPNGHTLEAIAFEFRAWANVIALTPDQQVVLIRQYRHGVRDVLWEIPGGVVEDGEAPLEGVKRELLEETGYTATEFVQVGQMYPNPALQTNTMYCFLALGAEKVVGQALDSGEDIEVHLVPLDELVAMAKRGDFPHALQVALLFQALAYLDRIK
jgi:8-oxo-dGTP pyrophosphatase MutT (NUDIX family)